ncbi:hypothetical protein AURDEDRAFT_165383 [Auricularia subglabra TFB-10046 SS5]|nr:hypothetical protein AURDEDRAFT_165383 [Auricularia subglabra TFB-10046 SS5]
MDVDDDADKDADSSAFESDAELDGSSLFTPPRPFVQLDRGDNDDDVDLLFLLDDEGDDDDDDDDEDGDDISIDSVDSSDVELVSPADDVTATARPASPVAPLPAPPGPALPGSATLQTGVADCPIDVDGEASAEEVESARAVGSDCPPADDTAPAAAGPATAQGPSLPSKKRAPKLPLPLLLPQVPPFSPFIPGFPHSQPIGPRRSSKPHVAAPASQPGLSSSHYATRSTGIGVRLSADEDLDTHKAKDAKIAELWAYVGFLEAQRGAADAHNTILFHENAEARQIHDDDEVRAKRERKSAEEGSSDMTVKMGAMSAPDMREIIKENARKTRERDQQKENERHENEEKKNTARLARLDIIKKSDYVFTRRWATYNSNSKDELVLLAEDSGAGIPDKATKDSLYERIGAFFEGHPEKKSDPRYEQLWRAGRPGRRKALPERMADAGDGHGAAETEAATEVEASHTPPTGASRASTSLALPPAPSIEQTAQARELDALVAGAFAKYMEQSGLDLSGLDESLPAVIDSDQSINALLDICREKFLTARPVPGGIKAPIQRLARVLSPLCATCGEGVALVFPPGKVIFAAVELLLKASESMEKDSEGIIDAFDRITAILSRIHIAIGGVVQIPESVTTEARAVLKRSVVEVLVEVLAVLGVVRKRIGTPHLNDVEPDDSDATIAFIGSLLRQSNRRLSIILTSQHNLPNKLASMSVVEMRPEVIAGDLRRVVDHALSKGRLRDIHGQRQAVKSYILQQAGASFLSVDLCIKDLGSLAGMPSKVAAYLAEPAPASINAIYDRFLSSDLSLRRFLVWMAVNAIGPVSVDMLIEVMAFDDAKPMRPVFHREWMSEVIIDSLITRMGTMFVTRTKSAGHTYVVLTHNSIKEYILHSEKFAATRLWSSIHASSFFTAYIPSRPAGNNDSVLSECYSYDRTGRLRGYGKGPERVTLYTSAQENWMPQLSLALTPRRNGPRLSDIAAHAHHVAHVLSDVFRDRQGNDPLFGIPEELFHPNGSISVLSLACFFAAPELARYLLDADDQHWTPDQLSEALSCVPFALRLYWRKAKKNTAVKAIVNLLVERGVNPGTAGNLGCPTAFERLCFMGRADLVWLLCNKQLPLDGRADVDLVVGEPNDGHSIFDSNTIIDCSHRYRRLETLMGEIYGLGSSEGSSGDAATGATQFAFLTTALSEDEDLGDLWSHPTLDEGPLWFPGGPQPERQRFSGPIIVGSTISGMASVVQALVDSGANVNAPSATYGSALQVAAALGRLRIARILIGHCDDQVRVEAFIAAVETLHYDIAQLLAPRCNPANPGALYACLLVSAFRNRRAIPFRALLDQADAETIGLATYILHCEEDISCHLFPSAFRTPEAQWAGHHNALTRGLPIPCRDADAMRIVDELKLKNPVQAAAAAARRAPAEDDLPSNWQNRSDLGSIDDYLKALAREAYEDQPSSSNKRPSRDPLNTRTQEIEYWESLNLRPAEPRR